MPHAIDFHVHLPTTEFMQVTPGRWKKGQKLLAHLAIGKTKFV